MVCMGHYSEMIWVMCVGGHCVSHHSEDMVLKDMPCEELLKGYGICGASLRKDMVCVAVHREDIACVRHHSGRTWCVYGITQRT